MIDSVIYQFAAGDSSFREQAIKIHRIFVQKQGRVPDRNKWPIEHKFMSEVDTPCPDLMLRAMYRKEVLAPETNS